MLRLFGYLWKVRGYAAAVILLRMVFYAPIIGIGGVLKVIHTRTGLGWIIVVAVAISGSMLAIRGTITVGDIQAFIQYVKNFTQPITQVAQVSNMLQSAAAAGGRPVCRESSEADRCKGRGNL